MATKAPKKKTAAHGSTPAPTYAVSDCTINNGGPANEHTSTAIVALAGAIKANADAIVAAADALKGAPANMDCGIRLGA